MHLLGEPSRYSLARALNSGGKCVTELALEVRLSQSCTTRHLQALERERVVRAARAGKRVIYALRRDDPLVAELLVLAGVEGGQEHDGADRSGDGRRDAGGGDSSGAPRGPAPELHAEADSGDGISSSDSPAADRNGGERENERPGEAADSQDSTRDDRDHGVRRNRSDIEDFLL